MPNKINKYYKVDVYNRYVDIAFAHAKLDEFDINDLLSHPNPRVNEFSFILISRNTEKDNTITSKPLIAIYDKNIWKHHPYFTKERPNFKINFHQEYSCVHHSEEFDNNTIINIPCNNQEELIHRFNTRKKFLNTKKNIKKKILSR